MKEINSNEKYILFWDNFNVDLYEKLKQAKKCRK